ncbi:probable bifunctional dTTP/UTP pyrophosphatase/methyltransferase protein [Ptychodera flava]|uniref:probable bifunctional dTTP/UTP pyrophosphatase/methyltransferase protein n=1 Tax=Ptychodera flava TaxID=63121 RepID=UPI00396A3E76
MAEALSVWCDINQFIVSQTIITACKLRVFDHLKGEGVSTTDLAEIVDCNAGALRHMMFTLASMGYVAVRRVNGQELFVNTEKANKYVVSSSPTSLLPVALSLEKSYSLFEKMIDAVKEGKLLKEEWKEGAGERFRKMADDQEQRTAFLQNMDALVQNMRAPVLMNSFDFSDYKSACDLGGGSGGLAYHLSTAYPDMKITIIDLPKVAEAAEQFRPPGCSHNVSIRGADMLKDELPQVDMFLLAAIIHDWPMDKVNLIFKRVFESLNPGGAVVVVETLFDDHRENSKVEAHLFSLRMSLLGGGKQWSGAELGKLLTEHGFVDIKIHTSEMVYGVVMATKPSQ